MFSTNSHAESRLHRDRLVSGSNL